MIVSRYSIHLTVAFNSEVMLLNYERQQHIRLLHPMLYCDSAHINIVKELGLECGQMELLLCCDCCALEPP